MPDKKHKKKLIYSRKLIFFFSFSLFDLMMSGFYLAIYLFSNQFLVIHTGLMNISINYVWLILIGLTMRPFLGIITCLVCDNLALFIGGAGISQWIWAYAIIPIFIYFICYFFKKLFLIKNERIWFLLIIFFILISFLFPLIISFIEKEFVNKKSDNNLNFSCLLKIFLYLIISFSFLFEMIMFYVYWKFQSPKIKIFLNLYSLVVTIIIFVIWIWGPIAEVIWLNRFSGNKDNYWSSYHLYLFARILKTPFILPLYLIILIPLYSVENILQKKIEKNKW